MYLYLIEKRSPAKADRRGPFEKETSMMSFFWAVYRFRIENGILKK